MKTTITILSLCLFIFAGTQSAQAQEYGDKVYGFGYAYSVENKVLYISNIVEGVQDSDIYLPASGTDLGNQWHDYFKAQVDNYSRYHIDRTGFIGKKVSSYNKIDEKRTQMIGEYRQNGYDIHFLDYFRFRKTKYGE
ncbi:MAG: hypothetical protein WCY25_01990 [Moheibacter sp.]